MNKLASLNESLRWKLMVAAARRGAEKAGFKLTRRPGKGLSNVYDVERGGVKRRASIRTTRDRWIAFMPKENGTVWKTLDAVDLVIVATVDSKEDPKRVQVFIFEADEVRKRFDQAYKERTGAGNVVKENFGMWVGLDKDHRGGAYTAGSGIVEGIKPEAVYEIDDLIDDLGEGITGGDDIADEEEIQVKHSASPVPNLKTVADVKEWARQRVAEIAGVDLEAVKIDLRIEY